VKQNPTILFHNTIKALTKSYLAVIQGGDFDGFKKLKTQIYIIQ